MIVGWEALAFVFALLPGIAGIAYCYSCGRTRESPTWSGYWKLLSAANTAKANAYKRTAGLFSSYSPRWMVRVLAWVFMAIVALVGPGQIMTLLGIALCIPGSAIGYWIGRNQAKWEDR